MAINGDVWLGDLTGGDDAPFLLAGSLEWALPLPLFTVQGAGNTGGVMLPYEPLLQLPAFTLAASTADGLRLPAWQVSATGDSGILVTGRVQLPAFGLSGALDGALPLPAFQLAAMGHAGIDASASLQLPALSLEATGAGGFGVQLAPLTMLAHGLAGAVATASAALPPFSSDALGLQDGQAVGQLTFSLLSLDAAGGSSAVIEGAVTIERLQLDASLASGNIGSAVLTLPLYALEGQLLGEAIGQASVTLPIFTLDGVITVPRAIPNTIVLNTRLKGVTRYEGLDVNSYAQFAGVTLAATTEGIVALTGDTDLGKPIAASVVAGTSDLGTSLHKRVQGAFIGYRAGGEMEMTLITDEHHEYTYRLAPRQIGDTLHGTRVKFGRGVDGRYWQWKLANLHGAAFDLASLQLQVAPLARSV